MYPTLTILPIAALDVGISVAEPAGCSDAVVTVPVGT